VRVIVTGAGGFLGRHVVAQLSRDHDILATDITPGPDHSAITGDLCDPDLLERLFAKSCDAVIHLASLPGGACETDPAKGWQVNVEATRALAAAAVQHGVHRFIYASSIAVFGDVGRWTEVDDQTPVRPTLLYGAHKAMMEAWLATLGRRGALQPLALRLPGLVARPGQGLGLKSAFLSDVFHAGLAQRPIRLPVSDAATMWLMSGQCAADNLARALLLPATSMPRNGTLTLPALRVRMAELVAAIARHTGHALQVDYAPDPLIERDFGAYPPLRTPDASVLGFAHDGDLDRLVAAAMEGLI
jgi:nucleoside-diphosphate-sugar epimerase